MKELLCKKAFIKATNNNQKGTIIAVLASLDGAVNYQLTWAVNGTLHRGWFSQAEISICACEAAKPQEAGE